MHVSTGSFADPAGDGEITLSAAELEEDPDDIAGCASIDSGVPWIMSFIMDGSYILDFSGNEIAVAFNDGTPTLCTSFPVGVSLAGGGDCSSPAECLVICPLCLPFVPTDVATQVEDDIGTVSNAQCVTVL